MTDKKTITDQIKRAGGQVTEREPSTDDGMTIGDVFKIAIICAIIFAIIYFLI